MDVGAANVSQVMAAYTRALRQLSDRIQLQMAWNHLLVDAMESEVSLHHALTSLESSRYCLEMTHQLAAFEKDRFDMRAGLARILRAQGLSNPEIADTFGVSRQLVHRILAEEARVALEVNLA
jgi:hypothetical protein